MKLSAIGLTSAALFVALFAQGCATGTSSQPSNVPSAQSGVNCTNAQEDLSRLEHEKASTAERMEKGVTSIMPIGLVISSEAGSVAGNEDENLEIASGDYNKKIDARIAEIKQTCNIQ